MENSDKIIVALDVADLGEAEGLVRALSPHVGGFKAGLELLTAHGAPEVMRRLRNLGAKVFFDGKFKDIPNTVAAAAREASKLGAWMFTVHAAGGRKMMEAAAIAARETAEELRMEKPLVLAVTILTSMDVRLLREVGFDVKDEDGLKSLVVRLAKLAKSSGAGGVIASPKEIAAIKEACGADFKVVTPGVRPSWAAAHDQRRVMTPQEAVSTGADYIVIGRPVTRPPEGVGSPIAAVKRVFGF